MTTGNFFRDYLQQCNMTQEDASFVLGTNVRTVRRWVSAPNKYYKDVPDWVIPELAQAMGRIPHAVVDKFIIGRPLKCKTGDQGESIYLIHTQNPRFVCQVVPVHKFVSLDKNNIMFAQGERLMKDFQFFDTPFTYEGIKETLDHACQIMNDRRIAMY